MISKKKIDLLWEVLIQNLHFDALKKEIAFLAKTYLEGEKDIQVVISGVSQYLFYDMDVPYTEDYHWKLTEISLIFYDKEIEVDKHLDSLRYNLYMQFWLSDLYLNAEKISLDGVVYEL